MRFVGQTSSETLSACGEHLIGAEVESAMARAASTLGASVRDWHAGPVFPCQAGHHRFNVEYFHPASDLETFRWALAGGRRRPARWLRRLDAVPWSARRAAQGPRLDGSGALTAGLMDFLQAAGLVAGEVAAVP